MIDSDNNEFNVTPAQLIALGDIAKNGWDRFPPPNESHVVVMSQPKLGRIQIDYRSGSGFSEWVSITLDECGQKSGRTYTIAKVIERKRNT